MPLLKFEYITDSKFFYSIAILFIGKNEISIGNAYRNYFFDEFVAKKLLSR